ncbi:hypothetical protein QQG74_09400 [Micromonospora sp. FIMYZ51]|uniref:hypothetical protein n=1 Tax=Micromonospora sp. FIMYZ51 TaxID=3051832 RepID=UPI0031201443
MKTTVEQLVAQVAAHNAEQFSPTRYPYTYSADFIRQNPHVVPAHIRDQVPVEDPNLFSRSEAARMKTLWAAAEGRDVRELAEVLADAYMQVWNIQRPEETP